MNLNVSAWAAGARHEWDRRRIHPVDPLPPDTSGRFRASKNANIPINEYWRQCAIEESSPCDTMMPES
jgi:hypothetical protein